jgi:hypothetical protein
MTRLYREDDSMRNLAVLVAVASAATVAAQPISKLPDPVQGDIAKRGAAHVRLDPLVGEWNTAIKFWAGPEQDEATELSGKVRRQWIYGGRFLEEHIEEQSKSDVFLSDARGRRPETHAGVVYHGMGLFGYDRLTGLYKHVYVHDDSTRMYYKTGRYLPERNVIELSGTWTIPHNGVLVHARYEIQIESLDRHTLVRYISDEQGVEFKDLEVTHVRKK